MKARQAEAQARELAMEALASLTDDVVEQQLARQVQLTEEDRAVLRKVEKHYEAFAVLSGDDAWTVPLIACGADGLVSVASNEIPRLMKEIVSSALRGDFKTARTVNARLMPLLTGNFIESNPIPVKTAMKMMGILENDTVRSPLAPLADANRQKMEQILAECGLPEAAGRGARRAPFVQVG